MTAIPCIVPIVIVPPSRSRSTKTRTTTTATPIRMTLASSILPSLSFPLLDNGTTVRLLRPRGNIDVSAAGAEQGDSCDLSVSFRSVWHRVEPMDSGVRSRRDVLATDALQERRSQGWSLSESSCQSLSECYDLWDRDRRAKRPVSSAAAPL